MSNRPLVPLLLLAGVAFAAEDALPLTVAVSGLRDASGALIVMVFAEAEAEAFPTGYARAAHTATVTIAADGTARVVTPPLPPGRYAVRVHHDADGDGRLAKRLFRPREGLGFSRDAGFRAFGPPRFAECAVEHSAAHATVGITRIIYP